MNQLEYEALFIDEHPAIPEHARLFSQGNHQRSLIGNEWYYYGETAEEYALYKDCVVAENDTHVFIDMYEGERKLNSHRIPVEKKRLDDLYPVQSLFPYAMSEKEARAILRNHFITQQERSTTIEIPQI